MLSADSTTCESFNRLSHKRRYNLIRVATLEQALERLAREEFDLVIADLSDVQAGAAAVEQIQELADPAALIGISDGAGIQAAIDMLKRGACDFLVRPCSDEAIERAVDVALAQPPTVISIAPSDARCESETFAGIVGKSEPIRKVINAIRMLADSDVTVVIEGETGTGKEMVANAIHVHSLRRKGPLVTINCGGLPESLLESELFGYERGAFTGALQSKAGKLELASGGTLFLDEVESMSLAMQTKLLRVLEDRKVQRLGGTRWTRIDCRIIVASNISLRDLVARGQLRSDIYYRLNVVRIPLVPLRLRREDIPLLVQAFLERHPTAQKRGIQGIAAPAMKKLLNYSWPGNVRELQNVLERAIVFCEQRFIEKVELSDNTELGGRGAPPPSLNLPFRDWLELQEKHYIQLQIEASAGRVGEAARSMGVDLKTLYRKMRAYRIDKNDFKNPASHPTPSAGQPVPEGDGKQPSLAHFSATTRAN